MTGHPIDLPWRDVYRQPPITAECWARLRDAGDYNILLVSDTKQSSQHWEMYTVVGSGLFSVYLPGRGADAHSAVNLCDDQWHYLAMTLENAEVRLYVDGDLVKQADLTPLKGDAVPGGFTIGGLVEGEIGCAGAIQDVRISSGRRDVGIKPAVRLAGDAATLDLWTLDGSSDGAATKLQQTATPAGNAPTGQILTSASNSASAPAPAVTLASFPPAPTAPIPSSTPSFAHEDVASLPKYQTIPAAILSELTPANGWPTKDSFLHWTRSHGGPTGNRYSALTEINKRNVQQLAESWVYHSKDGAANIQCNPIVVDGIVYLPTAGLCLAAVDGATGKEMWRYAPEKEGNGLEDVPARRGLIYWPGDASNPARIIFTMGTYIYALDPKTGNPVSAFGQAGRTRLPRGGGRRSRRLCTKMF